jgi:proteasome lid subunit RPN8/RPN11
LPKPSESDASSLTFELPRSMWSDIVDHARQEAPRECCGLIAGRDGRPSRLFRLTNLAPGNTLYEIDPQQLYELEFRQLPELGLQVVAIYHSHPATEAYPSPTDQALAFWPEVVYLICSLANPEAPVVRAFQLSDVQVTEAAVVVVGGE